MSAALMELMAEMPQMTISVNTLLFCVIMIFIRNREQFEAHMTLLIEMPLLSWLPVLPLPWFPSSVCESYQVDVQFFFSFAGSKFSVLAGGCV